SKLVTAQRTAMKAILGCFHTTSTPALEIETGLAPAHLRLQSKILRSFTRMQTLPENHPTNSCIERSIKSKSRTFITNLEYLAQTFPDYTTSPERIQPPGRVPSWTAHRSFTPRSNKKAATRYYAATCHNPQSTRLNT